MINDFQWPELDDGVTCHTNHLSFILKKMIYFFKYRNNTYYWKTFYLRYVFDKTFDLIYVNYIDLFE